MASPAETLAWIRCERLLRSPILDVQMPESDCPTCAAETRRRNVQMPLPGKAVQDGGTCPAVGVDDALGSPNHKARTALPGARELLVAASSGALEDAAALISRIQGESEKVGAALEAVLQGVR